MNQRINEVAALAGDAQLGERLFYNPRVASCYRCHEANGRGAALGPNLTLVQRAADRRRITESILDPNREIAPQFVPWVVTLHDGRVVTGVFLGEDDQNRPSYLDAQGTKWTWDATEIESRRQQPGSIMPTGLGDTLSDWELASLVSYLSSF